MKKTLGLAAILVMSTLLLAGCTSSPEQKALEADCEQIANRLSGHLGVIDTDYVEAWSWPAGYAVTNAGVASRETVITQAESLLPFFHEAFDRLIASNPDTSSYEYKEGDLAKDVFELEYLKTIVAGTQFELNLTEEEQALINTGTNDGSALLDSTVETIFGVSHPENSEQYGPCAGTKMPSLEPLKSDYSFDSSGNLLHELYLKTQLYMPPLAVAYVESMMCQTTGSFAGQACAADDYVSEPTEWTPTTRDPFIEPYGDETTQGIAEFAWCYNQGLEVNPGRTGCW